MGYQSNGGSRRRRLAACCAIATASVGLAACGSDDKSTKSTSTSAPTSASTTAAAAPKGAAYKLGFICSCTGAGAGSLSNSDETIKAWESTVNAGGGINGHPVAVTVIDDASQPAQALQGAKKLIDSGVLAIMDMTIQDAAFAKAADKAGVPVIGSFISNATVASDANFFPTGAVIAPVILGEVLEAKAAGKKNLGVMYCKESPACAQLVPLTQLSASIAGGGIKISSAAISFSQPSYAAPCLKLKSAGADATYIGAVPELVARIHDACAQQGYKPTEFTQTPTTGKIFLKNPNLEGARIVSGQAPWTANEIPEVKRFNDAVQKYAPDAFNKENFGGNDLSSWSGGVLFEKAAAAGNLTPTSTPAETTAAMYKLKDETLNGLSGPLNYVKGQPTFSSCYFVVGVEGGKFTAPKGVKPICPSQAQITAFGKALAKG